MVSCNANAKMNNLHDIDETSNSVIKFDIWCWKFLGKDVLDANQRKKTIREKYIFLYHTTYVPKYVFTKGVRYPKIRVDQFKEKTESVGSVSGRFLKSGYILQKYLFFAILFIWKLNQCQQML